MTEQPTKTCVKCQAPKPLLSFAGRQNTCIQCRDAAKARTMERKEAVAYSPELGERITDAIAAGIPVSEICAPAGMPTQRQISRWRRTIPEFADAYEKAREARADARSDKIDEALNDLRVGKITAADCRVIVETELKMAGRENPARYGDVTRADVTVRPGAPVEKPSTAAWLDKVLGAGAVASNVVPLLPAPARDEEDAA